MSVSTSTTDPVQAIIDILDGTTSWPSGTKPTYIQQRWEVDFQTKTNRADPSVYVWSPEVGPQRQFGRNADTKIQNEVINAEVWSTDDAEVDTIASDVKAILEDYWNEGKQNTEWNRIRPQLGDDRRAESPAMRAGMFVIVIEISLEREGSMGT